MTANHNKPSWLPPTQWSLVARAGASDYPVRDRAIVELLDIYAPALESFLIRSKGLQAEVARDVLQGFIAEKILSRRILDDADPDKGRFRNYLLKALSRFALTKLGQEANHQKRAQAFVDAGAPTVSYQDTECFDQEWVRALVGDALRLMEADCRERGREDLWQILRLRAVDPILHGSDPVGYGEVVEQLGLRTPREAINLLVTAKRSFVRHLRLAVGRYVEDPEEIDQEIADLREIVWR